MLAQLDESHSFQDVKKTDLYSCKSLLLSALRKMELNFRNSAAAEEVREMAAAMDEKYNTFGFAPTA